MDTVAVRAARLEEIPHESWMTWEVCLSWLLAHWHTLGKELMAERFGVHNGGRIYPPGRLFSVYRQHDCWFRTTTQGQ